MNVWSLKATHPDLEFDLIWIGLQPMNKKMDFGVKQY
jgi:hypothetical protein